MLFCECSRLNNNPSDVINGCNNLCEQLFDLLYLARNANVDGSTSDPPPVFTLLGPQLFTTPSPQALNRSLTPTLAPTSSTECHGGNAFYVPGPRIVLPGGCSGSVMYESHLVSPPPTTSAEHDSNPTSSPVNLPPDGNNTPAIVFPCYEHFLSAVMAPRGPGFNMSSSTSPSPQLFVRTPMYSGAPTTTTAVTGAPLYLMRFPTSTGSAPPGQPSNSTTPSPICFDCGGSSDSSTSQLSRSGEVVSTEGDHALTCNVRGINTLLQPTSLVITRKTGLEVARRPPLLADTDLSRERVHERQWRLQNAVERPKGGARLVSPDVNRSWTAKSARSQEGNKAMEEGDGTSTYSDGGAKEESRKGVKAYFERVSPIISATELKSAMPTFYED